MMYSTIDQEELGTFPTRNSYDRWINAAFYNPAFEEKIQQELERLRKLDSNWDAQGAVRISSSVIAATQELIAKLPKNLAWTPSVVPMAKGNLQLEWHDGPRSLELEIEEGSVHYLKWHPEEGVEEEGRFPISKSEQAVALIRWFTGGAAHA